MIRYYIYGSYLTFKKAEKKIFLALLLAKTRLFVSSFVFTPVYNEGALLSLNRFWGFKTPFIKTLLVRGIGYRLLLVENKSEESKLLLESDRFLKDVISFYSQNVLKSYGDTVIPKSPITNKPYTKWKTFYDKYYSEKGADSYLDDYRSFHDLQAAKFLIVRVGHTTDTIIPLSRSTEIKTHKKERKITLYGPSKVEVRNLARVIYRLRKPSPYTGRGVKFKHVRVNYKKVRKTKAGGRAF